MADPATVLASNSVLGPYFPLRTACLFTSFISIYLYRYIDIEIERYDRDRDVDR